MELLVCVINEPRKVDDILQAFLEIGVTGATVLDSYGMGGTLIEDLPIFAGFRGMLGGGDKQTKTIFSVIRDEPTLRQAVEAVERACGDLNMPSTGIMFSVPVNFVKGIKPAL